jgi:hypothetical protein
LSLIPFEHRSAIAEVYYRIEDQNYQTRRIHDYEVQYNAAMAGTRGTMDAGQARAFLEHLKDGNRWRRRITNAAINNLLEEGWL